MAHALNFVIPIKQDPKSLAQLATLQSIFAEKIQPQIDAALRKSQIVHFARLFVIDNKYLLVITEFDGGDSDYTEFFRRELKDIFALLFSLSEKVPPAGVLDDAAAFWEFSKGLHVRSLGKGDTNSEGEPLGYLFSAYGNRKVKDILATLG